MSSSTEQPLPQAAMPDTEPTVPPKRPAPPEEIIGWDRMAVYKRLQVMGYTLPDARLAEGGCNTCKNVVSILHSADTIEEYLELRCGLVGCLTTAVATCGHWERRVG